jgi:hypothetical protein
MSEAEQLSLLGPFLSTGFRIGVFRHVQQEFSAMLAYPKVDLSLDRLRRGGWAMGDLCVDRPEGRVWIVTGQRRKHWIIAQAPSQAAAWWLAWEQAAKLARPKQRTV